MTEGACIVTRAEWSMCPLCSSIRATPLKIKTTARRSVHTLIGSKEAFRTKTRPVILPSDITGARPALSKKFTGGSVCLMRGSHRRAACAVA
jgi:hypothetical protein